MTDFLQHYKLKFTPLSPVHIGTNESYVPTNYVIDNDTLYEFDTNSIAQALYRNEDRKVLADIVSMPNAEMLKKVQKYFYDRRDLLKPWATNTIHVLNGVSAFYLDRIGEKDNKLEIDRCAYNPVNYQPLLFGSSIKGAIRTALLSHANCQEPLKDVMDRKTNKLRKENNQELQQRLLHFRPGRFELDPLRLIQISDASWLEQEHLPKTQIWMAVNRKKSRVLDDKGNERISQSESKQSLNKFLECVPAWRYRPFAATINIQQVSAIKSDTAKAKLPDSALRFKMSDIAKICSAFYLPKLKAEIQILRDRDFIDKEWDNNIQTLLDGIKERLIKGEAFLLRVGRHSGAESVTLNGDNVRSIKILEGKNPQDFSRADKTKTLWLAAEHKDQRTNLLPFGWLLVEIESDKSTLNDWPELAAICDKQNALARLWADKQMQEQGKLSEERQVSEDERKKQEAEREKNVKMMSNMLEN